MPTVRLLALDHGFGLPRSRRCKSTQAKPCAHKTRSLDFRADMMAISMDLVQNKKLQIKAEGYSLTKFYVNCNGFLDVVV